MEITHFLEALWQLSVAMAPYILFGLLFAGILHELVPETLVTKHLGNETLASVIKATLFGIPLPLCSCGVIPLATSIKKSGASKGATLSFLISTPITGIDSIMATYGIFGWIFTLYRLITSMIMAIVAGILTNIFQEDTQLQKSVHATPASASDLSPSDPLQEEGCCAANSCLESGKSTQGFSFMSAMHYAFVTLFSDIAKALFWGLLFGALITVIIPEDLSELLKDHGWLSYLIVIAIAVPMYVCATASLPIAAGLILSGVNAGAAFVFLSAGPATNTVTIGVVKKMLGKRSLGIYLGSIIIGSILFGVGLDYIFDISSIDPVSLIIMKEEAGLISTVSSVILWGLILYFVIKPYFIPKSGGCCTG